MKVNRIEVGEGFFVVSAGDSSQQARDAIRAQVRQAAAEARAELTKQVEEAEAEPPTRASQVLKQPGDRRR